MVLGSNLGKGYWLSGSLGKKREALMGIAMVVVVVGSGVVWCVVVVLE